MYLYLSLYLYRSLEAYYLHVHVLKLGAVGAGAQEALKQEKRLAPRGEAAAQRVDVGAELGRLWRGEQERAGRVADGYDERVVRDEWSLGEAEVAVRADAGHQLRLELRRRDAEPARLRTTRGSLCQRL